MTTGVHRMMTGVQPGHFKLTLYHRSATLTVDVGHRNVIKARNVIACIEM